MKKITLLATILIVTNLAAKAQCDKSIKWTSSRSEYLDTSGNFQHSDSEAVELTTTPKQITIVRGNSGSQVMTGDIEDYSCEWKDRQNGKTIFKSVLVENGGKTRHATITIEGTNGKTTILLEAEEENTKIRLNVDSFEDIE